MRPRSAAIAAVTLGLAAATAGAAACSDDGDETTKAAPDAAAPETGAEAGVEDVPDAAPLDAAKGPFCTTIDAASVLLCSDFESDASALWGFDESVLQGDASALGVSDEGGLQHPSRVLDTTLAQTADDAAAPPSVFLAKNLGGAGQPPSSFSRYEVELDFRVVGPASLAYVALGVLGFPAGAIKEHGFAVYDGNVFGRIVPKDLGVRDDQSKWHHALIVLAKKGGAASFATTIDIDGTLVDNVGGVDVGSSGVPRLRVGAFGTSPAATGAIRAQFDNVVVRRW